ncbi:MAG: DMP19 family protein [Paludibacteraceae bacterium]|nr:DMP19 family protein [Paludibacteraceae bacterium]
MEQNNCVVVKDADLQAAAQNGPVAFLNVILDAIGEVTGDEFGAEEMAKLNGNQHALNSLRILRDEFEVGGFVNLTQDGFGPYIFDNPFAKALRLWGAHDLSQLVYKAKRVFDANRTELTTVADNDEDFGALFDKMQPLFEKVELEIEAELPNAMAAVAAYVDENIEQFISIQK